MSKSEGHQFKVTKEEIFAIFDVIDKRGDAREAQKAIHRKLHVQPPHRTTVMAVFRVGVELFKRNANVLTDQEVDEIVEKAGYGMSPSRVVELHRSYQLWKTRSQNSEMPKELLEKKTVPQITDMTTVSEKYLIDHYHKLHKVMEQLYGQLCAPKLSELSLFTLKGRITISHSYVSDMHMPAIRYEEGTVKLDVEDSDSFLWECLKRHLIAEFPEFDTNLSHWKKNIATIVEKCHSITKTIANQSTKMGTKMGWDSANPYLSPDSKDYKSGVYYDMLTALIYECVITNYPPQFDRVSGELVMECPTGRKAIARGDTSLLDQVEQCPLGIVSDNAIKEKVEQVLDLGEQAEAALKPIKQNLRLVLERGTFKGTCSVCSDLISQGS